MKLYEIAQNYEKFAMMVEDGEIPEDAIADTFEALEGDLEVKADNIASLIKGWSAESEAIKSEEEALSKRRKTIENQTSRMKNTLSAYLLKFHPGKITTARNAISFRESSALEILNESNFMLLYPELVKISEVKSISKAEISDLIKSGIEFDGAEILKKKNIQIK